MTNNSLIPYKIILLFHDIELKYYSINNSRHYRYTHVPLAIALMLTLVSVKISFAWFAVYTISRQCSMRTLCKEQ